MQTSAAGEAPYKDYKIKDGKTVAILSLNENGEMQSRGFRDEELERLINQITKK